VIAHPSRCRGGLTPVSIPPRS